KGEMDRLSEDARSRRMEAQRLSESAAGLRAMGNEDEARAEESKAAELTNNASERESKYESAASELRYMERQLRRANQQISEEESRYKATIAQLQQRKEDLEGGVGSYTSLF